MKKIKLSFLFLFSMFVFNDPLFAQTPGVRWGRYLNSGAFEFAYDAKPTSDKGFIVVGADTSFGYSISTLPEKIWGGRPWIVKTDSAGNITWKKGLGSVNTDRSAFTSVIVANDGGYVATGFSVANGGLDTAQLIIAKYNTTGSLVWQKAYGGTRTDIALSISKTLTNGFIIAGYTNSTDGDVIGNHAANTNDLWLLRIDDNGNIIWKKCFGGAANERGESVTQMPDYSFLIAGSASSTNGDLTGNNGATDGWLLKTDSSGNLLWQKNYGGQGSDAFKTVIINSDLSITAAGNADSTISITNGNKPGKNMWVVKTNSSGNLIWSIAYGGSGNESALALQRMLDNSYLITGYTTSNNNDVSGNNGNYDAWLTKISSNGYLLWQKCIGTSKNECGFAGVSLSEFDFVVAGTAEPLAGQNTDGYIVKLGNSNIIKGSLFFDANSNGIKDASELFFNNATVKTQKAGTVFTAQPNAGKFSFDVDTGSYTTTVQLFNPYYTVVPASKNTNFTTYLNVDSFSFAVQPIPNQQDLIVHLIPASPARPGFKAQYVLNYKNVGTTTIANGTVKFIKDSRTSLSVSLPVPTSVVADTITWAYTNLKPLDSVSIGIEMNVAPPPTVNINDTLKFTAIVLPVVGDLTPANDTASLRQRVQGSYDPNDKQESYAGRMPVKDVTNGSYINYVIRFQNTGNDTAFFVRLLDTLDAKLDWNSFQMIGSSHSYNLTIKDGNKLNWFFDNIKLPDSTTNLIKSNGYVAFRIKPKNTLVANDVIANKASIYFDYNLPVVTNTTLTTVVPDVVTGIRDVQNNEMKLIVAPNPNAGQSVLQISGKLIGKFQLKMIDNTGRIIMNQTLTRNNVFETLQVPMDLQQLPAGVYYIQLQQKEKLWWQKVVLQ